MRYNRFQTDPISKGNPAGAICLRYDLSPTNPAPMGCTDSKVGLDILLFIVILGYQCISNADYAMHCCVWTNTSITATLQLGQIRQVATLWTSKEL